MNNPETLLAEQGFYAAAVHGHSMEPLLRNHSDTVFIEPPQTLKRMDTVLFRRQNGQLVLHRLLKQNGDRLTVCGDNEFVSETIDRSRVIGVMTSFTRGKHTYRATARWVRLYARAWNFSFPTKRVLRTLYRAVSSIKNRHGGHRHE